MFAYPNIKVSRMNVAPLLPEKQLRQINLKQLIADVEKQLIQAIRDRILMGNFSPEAKKRLAEGFKVVVGERSVTVVATDPAFRPLLEGQRARQMRWLVKAGAPIPIITDTGELIFRSATPKSMDNGSWYHPGRKPTTVIEKAKDEVRKVLRGRAKEILQTALRGENRKK